MARVIAYEARINGIDTLITNQEELKRAVKATQDEYNKSDFGSKKRDEALKQLGALKQIQKENRARKYAPVKGLLNAQPTPAANLTEA
jgi:hypothetical protein